jgi:(p)ppGpp synthase/HD superfamily hydrolase
MIRALQANHPKADTDLVVRAYKVAEQAHRGQTRKSGDDYITHPIAVATILAEIGMLPVTLAAALLHDTVEDTSYSLDQLTDEFGSEVAAMVDGVTKLDKLTYGQAAQSETVRKMIVAMAKDIRVLVIKLADRLHNARTWRFVPCLVEHEEGARDPRDLCPFGPPAGYEHDQVGARRPVVPGPAPEGLRRGRAPRGRSRARTREVPGDGVRRAAD